MNGRPNIVLVHGAWADGSCWGGVIERLQADGFQVRAPQFPLTSLADDVARLRQVLDFQDGPTVVVGHSYGGQIMTALGEDAHNVAALVYIAAFGLDEGESLGQLLSQGPVRPRWRTCSPTPAASAGCRRRTSSSTSRPTSIRRGRT
jgi:pimeloyl-ACP methyl ester carboxylesterase